MLNELWVIVFTLVKSIVGDVDVKNKGTLQDQIDKCFTSASDGKKAIASAITGKGVDTKADAAFEQMAANIGRIKTTPNLQAKNAALSTASQVITCDAGYDGLAQVAIPAVSGTAGTGDVLAGKTFNSGIAGINKTGDMPNRNAWTADTTGNGNVLIPKGYHNGQGYVSGAGAYNKGVSDADARANPDSANYKSGYSAGVSAADGRTNVDSANYKSGYNKGVADTKKGTAGTGDVLSGKTFTNASSVGAGGTMVNNGGKIVDAGPVTQDATYTYLAIPDNAFYNTSSKLRALNSDLITAASAIKAIIASATISPNTVELVNSNSGGTYTFAKNMHCLVMLLGWNASQNGRAQIVSCNAPHRILCSRLVCSSHVEAALILVNASQGSTLQYITWGDVVAGAIFELD